MTWRTMRSPCSTCSVSSGARRRGVDGRDDRPTIAIEHPTRVRSLTSIMSTTGSRRVGQPTVKLILTAGRRPVPTQGDAVEMGIEMFRKVCGPTFDAAEFRRLAEASVARSFRPAGTGRQAAAIIASGDRTVDLWKLRVPTLVMHGMLDPLVRPSGGVATAKAIPGARLVMFNDMAHDLPRTRHAEMADEIAAIARSPPRHCTPSPSDVSVPRGRSLSGSRLGGAATRSGHAPWADGAPWRQVT